MCLLATEFKINILFSDFQVFLPLEILLDWNILRKSTLLQYW